MKKNVVCMMMVSALTIVSSAIAETPDLKTSFSAGYMSSGTDVTGINTLTAELAAMHSPYGLESNYDWKNTPCLAVPGIETGDSDSGDEQGFYLEGAMLIPVSPIFSVGPAIRGYYGKEDFGGNFQSGYFSGANWNDQWDYSESYIGNQWDVDTYTLGCDVGARVEAEFPLGSSGLWSLAVYGQVGWSVVYAHAEQNTTLSYTSQGTDRAMGSIGQDNYSDSDSNTELLLHGYLGANLNCGTWFLSASAALYSPMDDQHLSAGGFNTTVERDRNRFFVGIGKEF